jgi:hypothetical protein
MIQGYFNQGRPFVDGLLRLPADVRGAARFLVDTGADRSILHPADYRAMGLRYADFQGFPEESSVGIGGQAAHRRVPAQLFLRHDTGRFDRIEVEVLVARTDTLTRRLPSLLGRDVIDLYVLTLHGKRARLTLEYA